MKPKNFSKIRRIAGKQWYIFLRALKMQRLYRKWDNALLFCDQSQIATCCNNLHRYARKQLYYMKRLHT